MSKSLDSWPSTHASLLQAIKDPNDAAAWRGFVNRYRGPIVAYCRLRYGMQDAVAEDVAQDILLKLVRAIQKFQYDETGSFRGWLKTVTHHAVSDLFKTENRRPDLVTGSSDAERIIASLPARQDGLVDATSDQLRRDLLERAEQVVGPRFKNPKNWEAYLRRKQGQSAREIGAELGIAVAAVHKARSRALELIRAEIARMLRED